MCADAFSKLPNSAGWQPALPGKSDGGFPVLHAFGLSH
jgi:hypothetical protein